MPITPPCRTRGCTARSVVLLALALPAIAQAALTIAFTPTVLSLPIVVAQTQGFFAAEGVEIKLTTCSSGRSCFKQLFDGSAQLVGVTELPVVSISFERNDVAIVSTLATSAGNIRVIARKSAGIAKAGDLAGKRVGVMVGSSAHYLLDTYLLFHSIDPKQLKLVPLTSETLVGALETGQIDAMSAYTPHTAAALGRLGANGTVLEVPRLYTETYNLVAVRHAIAPQSVAIQKVLRALDRAERFIAEQPGAAKQLLMSNNKLPRATVDAVFPTVNYRLSLEQSLITAMEGEWRWAIREGHAKPGLKSPNYLEFVEPGPLRSAVPAALPK